MIKKILTVLAYLIIFGVLGTVAFIRILGGCDMISLH